MLIARTVRIPDDRSSIMMAIAAETARVVGPDEVLALASEERLETGDHIPAIVQALRPFQNRTPTARGG